MSKSYNSPGEAGTATTMALDEKVLSFLDANHSILAPLELGERRASEDAQIISPHSIKKEESQNEGHVCDWQDRTRQSYISKRKGRRKNDGILSVMSQWIVKHQIGMLLPLSYFISTI